MLIIGSDAGAIGHAGVDLVYSIIEHLVSVHYCIDIVAYGTWLLTQSGLIPQCIVAYAMHVIVD